MTHYNSFIRIAPSDCLGAKKNLAFNAYRRKKMKIKKLTALAMTTAMCAATIFGCGGSDASNETTTAGATNNETQAGTEEGSTAAKEEEAITASLKVWCPAEDQESGWIEDMAAKFSEAHPTWTIDFTYETCSEGDAGKMVTQDPTAAADVYFFANDQLTSLLDSDAIAQIGGSNLDYVKETNSETMVATVTNNGNVYGFPFTANTWFMYYNKSIFTEDDVKSLDTMLSKGKVAFPITNSWYFQAFYAAAGGVFCGANGDDEAAGIVLGDKGTAVTKYLVNLAKNPNFVKDDAGSGMAGLGDGSIGAIFSGTWDFENVKKALGDNIGICQLPTINVDGSDYSLKAYAGSKAIAVNPNSQVKQGVLVKLAQYLASEDAQLAHYEMRNIVPCNTKLLATDAVKNDALAQAQSNTVANTAIIQPANKTFNDNWWDNATTMANAIMDGVVTEDNAADQTTAFENAINGRD